MTDFQSALELALGGDLYFHITHTLKNLPVPGIERVPPSLTILRRGGIALLPDIIQISFYQE